MQTVITTLIGSGDVDDRQWRN